LGEEYLNSSVVVVIFAVVIGPDGKKIKDLNDKEHIPLKR